MRSSLLLALLASACIVANAGVAPSLDAPAHEVPTERRSPGHWQGGVFHWRYNPEGHPQWLGDAQARALVVDAARAWETCGVRMRYDGDTANTPGIMDGENVVGWRADLPAGVRGLTSGRQRDGVLLERDIAFAAQRTEFQRAPRLLRKVLVHEFGHAIGLTHSARCDDVMTLAATCARADPASLPVAPTPHDLERCRALYAAPESAAH